jgi:tetratricopeptide (TPR) repeat protein
MTIQERSEWIEKYINGELTGEELEIFELQLRSDSDLVNEVALQKDILQALSEKEVIDFRKKLVTIHEKVSSSKPTQGRIFKLGRVLALAAAVVALVLVGNWVFNIIPSKTISPSEIYAANFKAPEVMGEENNGERTILPDERIDSLIDETDFLNKADSLFNINRYEEAAIFLNAIPSEVMNEYPTEINYRLALLSMLVDEHEQAVFYFEKVITNYQSSRDWYTALSLLKIDGRMGDAKAAFEHLVSFNNPYQEEASKILKQLKE